MSPSDVWAVGLHCPSICGGGPAGPQPLIQHWDGTNWSKVTVPGLGPAGALHAVSVVSSSDIWAVGGTNAGQPLIAHWNGTAWSEVSSPVAGILYGVSARSGTNVWAVGEQSNGTGTTDTLILHWNGSVWSQVASPSPGGLYNVSGLKAVSVVSKSNAWAVGYYTSPQVPSGQMLILHWDGNGWSRATAPNLGSTESELSGISTASGGAWAVGQYCASGPVGCGSTQQSTLVLHWDGSTWTQVSSPNASTGNYLYAVTAPVTAGSWAVGYDGYGSGAYDPLILHWTGGNWTQVSSPAPSTVFNFLFQVSAYSARNAWAVGYYCVKYCNNEEIDHSLILHWNGTQWSRK